MSIVKSELVFYGTTTPSTNSQINEKITELENKLNSIELTTIPSVLEKVNTNNDQVINNIILINQQKESINNISNILNQYQENINTNTNNIEDIFSILEANGFSMEGQIDGNKTINLTNLGAGTYTLKFENEDGTETIIDTITIKE